MEDLRFDQARRLLWYSFAFCTATMVVDTPSSIENQGPVVGVTLPFLAFDGRARVIRIPGWPSRFPGSEVMGRIVAVLRTGR